MSAQVVHDDASCANGNESGYSDEEFDDYKSQHSSINDEETTSNHVPGDGGVSEILAKASTARVDGDDMVQEQDSANAVDGREYNEQSDDGQQFESKAKNDFEQEYSNEEYAKVAGVDTSNPTLCAVEGNAVQEQGKSDAPDTSLEYENGTQTKPEEGLERESLYVSSTEPKLQVGNGMNNTVEIQEPEVEFSSCVTGRERQSSNASFHSDAQASTQADTGKEEQSTNTMRNTTDLQHSPKVNRSHQPHSSGEGEESQLNTDIDESKHQQLSTEYTEVQEPLVSTEAEDGQEPQLRTEDSQEPQLRTENSQEQQLGTEESQEQQLGTEESQEQQLCTEESQEQQLCTEDSQEQQLCTEESQEQQLCTEDRQESQLCTEESQEPLLRTEVDDSQEPLLRTEESQESQLRTEVDESQEPLLPTGVSQEAQLRTEVDDSQEPKLHVEKDDNNPQQLCNEEDVLNAPQLNVQLDNSSGQDKKGETGAEAMAHNAESCNTNSESAATDGDGTNHTSMQNTGLTGRALSFQGHSNETSSSLQGSDETVIPQENNSEESNVESVCSPRDSEQQLKTSNDDNQEADSAKHDTLQKGNSNNSLMMQSETTKCLSNGTKENATKAGLGDDHAVIQTTSCNESEHNSSFETNGNHHGELDRSLATNESYVSAEQHDVLVSNSSETEDEALGSTNSDANNIGNVGTSTSALLEYNSDSKLKRSTGETGIPTGVDTKCTKRDSVVSDCGETKQNKPVLLGEEAKQVHSRDDHEPGKNSIQSAQQPKKVKELHTMSDSKSRSKVIKKRINCTNPKTSNVLEDSSTEKEPRTKKKALRVKQRPQSANSNLSAKESSLTKSNQKKKSATKPKRIVGRTQCVFTGDLDDKTNHHREPAKRRISLMDRQAILSKKQEEARRKKQLKEEREKRKEKERKEQMERKLRKSFKLLQKKQSSHTILPQLCTRVSHAGVPSLPARVSTAAEAAALPLKSYPEYIQLRYASKQGGNNMYDSPTPQQPFDKSIVENAETSRPKTSPFAVSQSKHIINSPTQSPKVRHKGKLSPMRKLKFGKHNNTFGVRKETVDIYSSVQSITAPKSTLKKKSKIDRYDAKHDPLGLSNSRIGKYIMFDQSEQNDVVLDELDVSSDMTGTQDHKTRKNEEPSTNTVSKIVSLFPEEQEVKGESQQRNNEGGEETNDPLDASELINKTEDCQSNHESGSDYSSSFGGDFEDDFEDEDKSDDGFVKQSTNKQMKKLITKRRGKRTKKTKKLAKRKSYRYAKTTRVNRYRPRLSPHDRELIEHMTRAEADEIAYQCQLRIQRLQVK